MPSSESLRIRPYLLTLKNAPPAPLEEQRASLELLVENYVGHPVPLPENTKIEQVDADGVPAEWISGPNADAERVLLYLHGGAYVLGSFKSHRDMVARLSVASGIRGLLIEYRLAPENVFPAAIDDALIAYRWLLANGTKPEHIVIGGDSAGGGLTLALLQTLRDKNVPMPAGAVLISPWTDLTGTVQSRTTKDATDPWISAPAIGFVTPLYAGSEDLHNPLISPIHANLHGFPPLFIHVGNDEVLLDDSLQVADHAKAADVPVELKVWDDMWHVFQAFAYVLPEAQQAVEQIGKFIRKQTKLA